MAARLTTFVVVAIVAVTLIAGLIVGAQRDDSDGPVDLIVHNARVYTAGPDGAMAEAVAIRGSQILRVGSDREILRLKRPQTTLVDAKGAAVLPGFNDAQADLIAGGAALDRIDLLDAVAIEDLERRVRDWAEANPDRPWVLGRGWHRDVFPDGRPTRQLLDRLVPDRPARLLSADGRATWVNSKALQMAKIGRRTAAPPHGAIGHDTRTGEPTGVLEGAAMAMVERLVPAATPAERDQALRAAIAEAHRVGITSVQDVTSSLDDLAAYAEARRTGDLPLRIYSIVPVTSDLPDAELDRLDAAMAKYPDDPLLKAGAVRVIVEDMPADAEAAGELTPAAHSLHFEPDVLNRLIRRLDARGWQILADATSAFSTRLALNAYEHAVRSNPTRAGERRHRLHNVSAIADDDLPRAAALGLLLAMAPVRDEAAADHTGAALAARLGSKGGRLAFGSGWPGGPLNPMARLAAVAGPTEARDGEEETVRLSLKSAIDAYTSRAAWASFDEQRKGTLAPGMLADLVVLSADIFKTPSTLRSARVEITIFDGKVVYRRAEHATN